MNGMRAVLVIGGSGFVGQVAVRAFQGCGCDVTVLNRGNRIVAGVRQLTADRDDPAALQRVLDDQCFDLVIDTVCYTPLQASILVDAIRGKCSRLLMISSATVYLDHQPEHPPTERDEIGGGSIWAAYSRNKSLAEGVYSRAQAYFDQVILVRTPYIFGPTNNLDRETWFWSRQLNGLPIILPGDGKTSVQFIHEDDLGNALFILATRADRGVQIFNAADAQLLTFVELADLLGSVAGRNAGYICLADRNKEVRVRSWFPFQDYPCLADPTKLCRLGWQPAQRLKDQFEQTYAALLEQNRSFAPALTDFEKDVLRTTGTI